jgi:hypothetical protein
MNEMVMKRAQHQTNLAAVFATAAELARRGYDVTFTLGNTPKVDLLCTIPDGPTFKVQVKGLSHKNGFRIDKGFFDGTQPDLLLVVVTVPPPGDQGTFEFYILSHAEAKDEFDNMPKFKANGDPYPGGSGLNWGSVKPYKSKWQTLPQPQLGSDPTGESSIPPSNRKGVAPRPSNSKPGGGG